MLDPASSSLGLQPPLDDAEFDVFAHDAGAGGAFSNAGGFGGHPDDDLFEATQIGPATQPQSLPNGTQQGEPDHWGRLIPLGQKSSEPLVLSYGKPTFKIGRNAVCDFVLDKEARVSNSHAAFHLSESDPSGPLVLIEDLKSSNGTYVNGQRLVPHKRRVLRHGDDISLGQKPSSNKAAAAAQGAKAGASAGVRLMFCSVAKRMLERCEIFEKYHVGEKIGSGTFAEVKRGMNLETGELVAIKEIQKHKFMSNKKTMQLFEREIEILGALSHPAICSFIECFEDDSVIYLVLEYIAGGNLLDFIMSTDTEAGMDEAQAQDITRQICVGMAYCHRQGVTHRDLKPENVLLTDSEPPEAKIADFGLAKMIEDSGGTMLKSMVGTPQYLAPEVVLHEKGEGYGQAVDSWSVGIIVYAMLTKLLPFSEDKDDTIEVKLTKRAKERVDYTPFDDFGVSGIAKDFVDRLLTIDATTRMSLETALLHPWLRLPQVAAPSALDEGALPTVTSLGKTEPMTARTDKSSGGVDGDNDPAVALSTVPSGVEDNYSQPFAKLNIEATLQQGVRLKDDAFSPNEDMSVLTDTARPFGPVSRFSSSSAAADDTRMDDDFDSAEQLGESASIAVEMASSAPDGRAPAVVHPPIAHRPAPPTPLAAPASTSGSRKRKHSATPSATPAPLDVFGGSSSLSSIGAEPRPLEIKPWTTSRQTRSASTGPSAAGANGQLHTPARQPARNTRRKDGGPSGLTPASATLRRSTRRRTTSPSRVKAEDEGDDAGGGETDEPSPVKRPTTESSRAAASARASRRRS